jgi:5-methylcytosine-specific restriction endonuclease McrA
MELIILAIIGFFVWFFWDIVFSFTRPKRNKPRQKRSFSSSLDSTEKPVEKIKPERFDQPQFTSKQEYLKSSQWQTIRKRILKRDHYTCCKCQAKDQPLEIHHLHYQNLCVEKDEDLVSLCRNCHESQHQHYGFEYYTKFYPLV